MQHILRTLFALTLLAVFWGCDDDTSTSTRLSSSTDASSDASGISFGEVIDARDNQVYKTVEIGTQTWMAINLNYDTLDSEGSWCWKDSSSYCDVYGRLYSWSTMMDLDSSFNSESFVDTINHRGICPEGWHVPTSSEWTTLIDFVGGDDDAGTSLKTTNDWGDETTLGNDLYGFSALPGGHFDGKYFDDAGAAGFWWSATEKDSANAYYQKISVPSQNEWVG